MRLKDELSRTRARMTVAPLEEPFVGAWMKHSEAYSNLDTGAMCDRQVMLQQLYETRFASLQRLISFMIMFHAMGKSVQDFWPRVSFGLLGYSMSRSQSMLRVASTAAPVSGSEVRDRIIELEKEELAIWAARRLQRWARWTLEVRRQIVSTAGKVVVEQSAEKSSEAMTAAELIKAMPGHYLLSTTIEERQVHLELYTQYKTTDRTASDERILVSWRRREAHVLLCVMLKDVSGVLSNISVRLSA